MVRIETGMLARSKAGHDHGKLYIIIRTEAEYVWLADGVCHTVDNPKKKKKKHIQIIHRIPEPVRSLLESSSPLQNGHIKQIIQSESQDRQEDKHV
ncbi:MAG: KOW domain-containing RNA-binding protein [Lachnospiraceae bacterium]